MTAASTARADRRLVALDIDGTVLFGDGSVSERVRRSVSRAVRAGHEVMLATGRSVWATLPVLEQLGLTPEYVVCANGAVVLRRDAAAVCGYRRERVETFDPSAVLRTISTALPVARYAVEDAAGFYLYTEQFPANALGEHSRQVPFQELLEVEATRVVVVSPNHDMEDFLRLVDRMGLHRVSYAVGWTAWLDIAPDGVNKATAMEWVRERLGVPRELVVAVGDGRNDIELLQWAGRHGAGVAMGQAPHDVLTAASAIAPAVVEDGAATVLDLLP